MFSQSNPKHTLSLHNALLKRITQLSSAQEKSSDVQESLEDKTEDKTESNLSSNTDCESAS